MKISIIPEVIINQWGVLQKLLRWQRGFKEEHAADGCEILHQLGTLS